MEVTGQVRCTLGNRGALLLPLVLVVVPFGREALDGGHLHVQHPLGLLGHPLLFKGVRDGAIHYSPKQRREETLS